MLVGDDMLRVLRLKAVVTCAEGHLSMFMSMQNQDTSWSSLLCIPFQGSWTSKIKLGGTQIIQIHIRDWQIHMIVVQITYISINPQRCWHKGIKKYDEFECVKHHSNPIFFRYVFGKSEHDLDQISPRCQSTL
jgi:hypothetical protein